MDPSWTYFLILGLSLIYPIAQSFEKRVTMYRKFRFILPAILLSGAFYIAWDIWFTHKGIWGFNHAYTRGSYLLGLPLEEWLFFLIVPYCCFFLFEVLRYFLKRFLHPGISKWFIIILLVLLALILPLVRGKLYTFTACAFVMVMLILQLLQKTHRTWFSGFLLMYIISLLPFMIVNGLLTSFPVVWYADSENLGLRLFTIPVEDLIYLFGLLLSSMNIYQVCLHRFAGERLRKDMGLLEISGF